MGGDFVKSPPILSGVEKSPPKNRHPFRNLILKIVIWKIVKSKNRHPFWDLRKNRHPNIATHSETDFILRPLASIEFAATPGIVHHKFRSNRRWGIGFRAHQDFVIRGREKFGTPMQSSDPSALRSHSGSLLILKLSRYVSDAIAKIN